MKKQVLKQRVITFLMLVMGIMTSSQVNGQNIIITPKLSVNGLTNVTSNPNSSAYPNYYEVNLKVNVMVNTNQSGKFTLSTYRKEVGSSSWVSITPNMVQFPNTGSSATISSTYNGTARTTQLEGTVYDYKVRVTFNSLLGGTGSKTEYTNEVRVNVTGVPVPCFKMLNVKSTQQENSMYGNVTVNNICLNAVTIDGSCSKFEQGYYVSVSEFNLANWTFGNHLYSAWVNGTGEAPSFISLNALAAQNNKYFQPGKLYIVGFSIGPVWKSATPQFFRVDTSCRIAQDNNGKESSADGTLLDSDEKENSVQLYPNPAEENFTIEVNKNEALKSCIFYDSFGTIVKKIILNQKSSELIELNDIKKGFYLLEIETDKNVYREKLIKK